MPTGSCSFRRTGSLHGDAQPPDLIKMLTLKLIEAATIEKQHLPPPPSCSCGDHTHSHFTTSKAKVSYLWVSPAHSHITLFQKTHSSVRETDDWAEGPDQTSLDCHDTLAQTHCFGWPFPSFLRQLI